jgi:hypothetical protein
LGVALTATHRVLLWMVMPKLGFKKTVTSPEGGTYPGGVGFSGLAGVPIRVPQWRLVNDFRMHLLEKQSKRKTAAVLKSWSRSRSSCIPGVM